MAIVSVSISEPVPSVATPAMVKVEEKVTASATTNEPLRVVADPEDDRVISDCHFAVQLNHFIPGFLSYSVAVFLK